MPAEQSGQAYHPISPETDAEGILCLKERRRVARDNTVQYRGRNLQLFPDTDKVSYAGGYVEVQERLDGQILACYKGKLLTPQDAPPLAATLRSQADNILDYPALWKEPPPPKPPRVRKGHKRNRKWIGPLAGEGNWFEDPVRRNKHSELTCAGMERARRAGRQIGMIPMEERVGFAERFAPILGQLEQKVIAHKQAAKKLGVSGPTLKRILDGQLTPTRQNPVANRERVALDV